VLSYKALTMHCFNYALSSDCHAHRSMKVSELSDAAESLKCMLADLSIVKLEKCEEKG